MGGKARDVFGNVILCKNKNIVRKCFVIIAHSGSFLVFKTPAICQMFSEELQEQLFPQIIYSHSRLSSAGVHVHFPFFIALFHREEKNKSIRMFSVDK